MVILCVSRMMTTSVGVDWHKWSVLLKAQDLIMLLLRMGTVSVGIRDISRRPRSNFMTKMIMPLTQMSILQVQRNRPPITPAVTHTTGPETVEPLVAQRGSSHPVKVPQRLIEQ